ncbi:MAG: isoleucine--tRNA ligase, partial [Moraxellaceae bacterium]|nr:isoleucine--tRNA ligase [Moraxellaceae bacterium]
INANLSAKIAIYADGEMYDSLEKLADELRFVFITSGAELHKLEGEQGNATDIDNLRVTVSSADGEKCVRCWHISDKVGTDKDYSELCPRCVSNVYAEGESRSFA